MSKEHHFKGQMEAVVFNILPIFLPHVGSFENWTTSLRHSPVLSGAYSVM